MRISLEKQSVTADKLLFITQLAEKISAAWGREGINSIVIAKKGFMQNMNPMKVCKDDYDFFRQELI
ncbi:hypothetical protein QU24_23085 [Pantoea rodasii]|uniref:Uncharacterized protein n=2 Tax=Pantoea TaxID=53335 RepID=A0A0U3UTN3_9GAMM|nr:hypothetical protein LK04_14275 [Pantoea vagans]KHJ65728.1 hypothetical protein QU24_23085 [Pantoea rodasii]